MIEVIKTTYAMVKVKKETYAINDWSYKDE